MYYIIFTTIVLVALSAAALHGEVSRTDLLDAIEQVETGGFDIEGDNGKAIGPYQIHVEYWQDAIEWALDHHDPYGIVYNDGRPAAYGDCHSGNYSRRIIKSYWERYGKGSSSAEVLARIHNGGPEGHKNKATLNYWRKVRKYLK